MSMSVYICLCTYMCVCVCVCLYVNELKSNGHWLSILCEYMSVFKYMCVYLHIYASACMFICKLIKKQWVLTLYRCCEPVHWSSG